jgi:hypothetical protein
MVETQQKAKSKINPDKEVGFNQSIDGVKPFEIDLGNNQVAKMFAKEQPDYNNTFICYVIEKKNEDGITRSTPKHVWINIKSWDKLRTGLDKLFKDVSKAVGSNKMEN